MPSACFIDTNVLLYVKDPRNRDKQGKARGWLAALASEDLVVVSPQVLNEFAHNVIRKFPDIGYDELLENLEAMRPWCVAPMTDEITLQGVAIHRRFQVSFYDSTLLAAALSYGCAAFLSEDLTHGQQIGDLRIINPFVVDPRAFLESD